MGVVWKAEDTRLGRPVAIKVLRPQLLEGARARERFEREARAIAALNHPHVCTLHDIGRHEDIDFIVMEYLDGGTLADRLKQGAFSLDEALRHGADIAEALDEAHRAWTVHRDLKPGNIMLTAKGVKLMDFGLAKIVQPGEAADGSDATTADGPLTEIGTLVGTVPYMSPEQLEGKETDTSSDIFALGGVLYELFTGKRAFAGSSQAALISAIMTADPAPVSELVPDAPALLDHVIQRCLAKIPGERWQSARDVARELEWIAGSTRNRQPAPEASISGHPYRIEYVKSRDGASIATARGGSGRPLLIVPAMVDTIETSWEMYARAFSGRELITYDRRGTGFSERGSATGKPDPYLQDAEASVEQLELNDFDVAGTLLGTTEAAWIASRFPERVRGLVLRAPTVGLEDWASIPGVRAALASLDQDWEYFTESFSQFVVGWGNPNAPAMAQRFRTITSREELRSLLEAFVQLDMISVYRTIEASTLIEHHPGYFFPDSYSRRVASMIPDCRMMFFAGPEGEFIPDLSIPRAFLTGE